jgi:hypothetical protein
MTQVKWLNRIVVLDRRYEGRHMARNYHSIRSTDGNLVIETSISRNRLKSVVARVGGDLAACTVSGAAWGGPAAVERVEVRVDTGPWRGALMTRRGGTYAWSLWSFQWPDPVPGTHTVVSRAIDSRGQIQPERSDLLSAREENSQWPRKIVVGQGFKK